MYGAGKIPDAWFEKVPGGYYKSKDGKTLKVPESKGGSRPSTSASGGIGQGRRRSAGERSRGPPVHDDSYQGGGSHRSSRRHGGGARDSYDGGADDDYYSGDDHRRRRNHSSTRRRKNEDDRYGYDDGFGREPRHDPGYVEGRQDASQSYPQGQAHYYPTQYPQATATATAGAGAAGSNARGNQPYPQTQSGLLNPAPPPSSSAASRSALANGYVPYANIYGQPQNQQYPPSDSYMGSVQTSPYIQMSHPVAPQQYQQNPSAQEAGAVPGAAGAMAGAPMQGRNSHYDRGYDPRHDSRYPETEYDPRYNERYRYDEHGRPYESRSRTGHRSRRRDRSPSDDGYDREDRRPRSERRDDDSRRTKSTGGARSKSMQRIKEQVDKNFDTSQKGIGFGLLGALAGGLAGNELGKGPVPTAIGAALGGGIANAFEAREKYVPSGYLAPSRQATPVTVDPRRPLNAQLSPREVDRAASSEPR